ADIRRAALRSGKVCPPARHGGSVALGWYGSLNIGLTADRDPNSSPPGRAFWAVGSLEDSPSRLLPPAVVHALKLTVPGSPLPPPPLSRLRPCRYSPRHFSPRSAYSHICLARAALPATATTVANRQHKRQALAERVVV